MLSIRFEILIREVIDFSRIIARTFVGPVVNLLSMLLMKIGMSLSAIKLALWAHRVSYSPTSLSHICNFLQKESGNKENLLHLVSEAPSLEEVASRILVIKWPIFNDAMVKSKGILIITFTRTFAFFLKKIDIASLEKYFHIVLEPSWAGYFDPDILSWSNKIKSPVFIQSSEILDRASIDAISSVFVPISIGASDWVDYRAFSPADIIRPFDSVYVANTSRMKRIHRYLKSISEIKSRGILNYRGALVCATWGGRESEVMKLCEYYDVGKLCQVFFNLDKTKLRDILCKSKVNILLSMKEGSNRSLFEAMFCNTPVLCLMDNLGVNKAYINEFTGMLTWDHLLASALLFMRKNWTRYCPREWAMENISPEVSTEKLCRTIAYSANDEFLLTDIVNCQSILIKVNRPEIEYFDFPKFDKTIFNSRFLEVFLISKQSNESAHFDEKLRKLKVAFDDAIDNS